MRAAVFAAKIALGLLLLAGGSLHAEDWPMDGRDLHHSFSNHQSGINPGNVAKLQSPDDSQMETPFQMETPLSRTYIFEILGVAAILYLIGSLRVLRQYERGVVFLLGKFEGVRGPGLTLIFLPIQQMVRVSLRTVTMQIPSQKIITKDNVSIDIAAVAYYHISDPEKAVIVIENVYNAINQISQTTVRNVVGRFSLDQLLSDTAGINLQIKNVIDGHTEPWGTKVTAVEIKDIVLPDNMQRAMAKEAEAERERRAKIVAAEGEYQAAVKLGQAADIITQHPVALQLRTLQTMAEISVEKNSTIIFPAQFMTSVHEAFGLLSKDSATVVQNS
jgi:regulator of protease activity HflC (stomatin/prohibitin superfamily)